MKIISKWTNNKLTRPRFSDSSGDVSTKLFNLKLAFLIEKKINILCNDRFSQILDSIRNFLDFSGLVQDYLHEGRCSRVDFFFSLLLSFYITFRCKNISKMRRLEKMNTFRVAARSGVLM